MDPNEGLAPAQQRRAPVLSTEGEEAAARLEALYGSGAPAVDADDASVEFEQARDQSEADAAWQELRALVGDTKAPDDDSTVEFQQSLEQSEADAAGQELEALFGGTKESDDDSTVEFQQSIEQNAGDAAYQRLKARYGSGAETAAPDTFPPQERRTTLQTIGTVAKDIGRGLIESPRQVVGGVRDAAQATLDMWNDAGNWLEEQVSLGRIDLGGGDTPSTAPQLPEVASPQSVTGGLYRGVSQFLTGFFGAGKVGAALKLTGKIPAVLEAAIKGGVADFTVFDPHQERLSNLVQKFPELQNPVTEFLAADPSDTALEGRLKNMVEGLGLGVVAEGFIRALKLLRQARILQGAVAEAPKELPGPDFSPIGDPAGELFTRRITGPNQSLPDPALPSAAAVLAPESEVFINFARIDAPEDIQRLIQSMANAKAGEIADAARGVRTWEQTRLSANQEDAWAVLMQRRQGAPLNAEQALAARQLWVTSAAKLSEVARLAAISPSQANLVSFRKMLATHYAIQSEVIAARTETARSLNAWKIPAGASQEQAQALDAMLKQFGGGEVTQDLAKRVAALSDAGMAAALESMVKGSVWARTKDAVAQVWINALLTNPATHVVNAMSNWSVALMQIVERRGAAYISRALGTQRGVELGEATAMTGAMVTGFMDALRAAWLTTKTGESAIASSKLEIRPGALASETWSISRNTPLGMALNVLDVTTRTPGRLLGVGDEFFKTIGYRMELAAQAQRMALSEAAAGTLDPSALKARIAEIIANPPENVRLEAVSAATYNTFTSKPAAVLKGIGDAIHRVPILGRLLLPFKNTPINILTYAAERSPMAPLVMQWRTDVAAGGARRDIALARMATGTMLMATTIDLAMSGTISGAGPADSDQRATWLRAGNQPYSIKINDKWVSYSRLDPIGMTLGIAADITDAMVNAGADFDQTDFEEVLTVATFAMANNAMSKTYMSGISQMLNALARPDQHGDQWVRRIASSLVPAGVAAIARQEDPYMRTADDTVQALLRRIPGLSADLPAYRDLWGRTVDYRSGQGALYDLVSPIYIKKIAPEPIDTELQRLEYFPSMPGRKIAINGVVVELDGRQYSRFVELAGNEAKDFAFGLGAKDFLNEVVGGGNPYSQIYKLYSDGPDGGKATFIRAQIGKYRERAKQQLLAEDAALQAQYDQRRKTNPGKFDPAVLGQ